MSPKASGPILALRVDVYELTRNGRFFAFVWEGQPCACGAPLAIRAQALRLSTQPFLDTARTLATAGVDPNTPIVMTHNGSEVIALRSTIGAAAAVTVSTSGGGRPIFVKYRPDDKRRLRRRARTMAPTLGLGNDEPAPAGLAHAQEGADSDGKGDPPNKHAA
jgi:hypothetical protein